MQPFSALLLLDALAHLKLFLKKNLPRHQAGLKVRHATGFSVAVSMKGGLSSYIWNQLSCIFLRFPLMVHVSWGLILLMGY
jgi:hypothetical protein